MIPIYIKDKLTMRSIYKLLLIIIIASLYSQEKPFKLKDGTSIVGTAQEETDSTIQVETKFGIVTINKSELLLIQYEVKLNSGETLVGIKIADNAQSITLKTQMGELTIQKSDIKNIQEAGQETSSGTNNTQEQYRRPYGFSMIDFLFSGRRIDKDTDFALGEEQLIDLFFDPTGYTLKRSTLYLSGLSFGFGVTEKFQITTKWGGFFYGNLNLRPKFQLFEKGNWEKQHSLAVGAHYHTRWWPNKHEWKSGSVNVVEFTGDPIYGNSNCPGNSNNCWEQTAPADTVTKYWGGYYRLGENPSYSTPEYTTPDDYYDPDLTDVYYTHEPYEASCIDCDEGEDEYLSMIELFGAYTFSKARSGLKGRISHTLGGNLQYFSLNDEPTIIYRAYYGLDVDINTKLKMIGELFYDPYFLELWQQFEFENHSDYYSSNDLDKDVIEKPDDYNPIHLDFGFIYALNESFRFGIHFQRPFVAFYWKF